METKTYYHFTGNTLRNGGSIPPIGVWLEHAGPVIPCESGYHASEHPFDALEFAPGNRLHRVELGDVIVSHGSPVDKVVSNRRRITANIDAEAVMRQFARRVALDVLPLWPNAPAVVKEYLETGREDLKDAAWAAAWAAGAAKLKIYREWFAEMVNVEFEKQGGTK